MAVASRLQLRAEPERYEAWCEAAARDGVTISEFARRAIEDRVAGRTSKAIARAVVTELLPELELMLDGKLQASPVDVGAPALASTPAGPQPWDQQCYEADLHRHGVFCSGCGGSYKGRA